MDPYTRARTIRIGKWRWPPPKDENSVEGSAEGFFEFKMRKMHERKMAEMQKSNGGAADPSRDIGDGFDEVDDDDDGIDWGAEYEKELRQREMLRRSQSKDSFDDMDDTSAEDRRSRRSPSTGSIGKK